MFDSFEITHQAPGVPRLMRALFIILFIWEYGATIDSGWCRLKCAWRAIWSLIQ